MLKKQKKNNVAADFAGERTNQSIPTKANDSELGIIRGRSRVANRGQKHENKTTWGVREDGKVEKEEEPWMQTKRKAVPKRLYISARDLQE